MVIETYLQQHLCPQLKAKGLPDKQLKKVSKDIAQRLRAVLSRWNDTALRSALLQSAYEEATFYEPADVALDVRALVVLAVRNSLLELISSSPEFAQRLGLAAPVLTARGIPELTAAAIQYFGALDLASVAAEIPLPPAAEDPFGHLPTTYPLTWAAFAHLGESAAAEIDYAPHATNPLELPPLSRPANKGAAAEADGSFDANFGAQLLAQLRPIQAGEERFLVTDSFQTISRHPEKLYHVLEFVLSHGAAVVTHNFYLTNGAVARRSPFLRPALTSGEFIRKFTTPDGLTPKHEAALAQAVGFTLPAGHEQGPA